MIMCRELSDEEILIIAHENSDYGGNVDEIAFARALFEAAKIQQTQER